MTDPSPSWPVDLTGLAQVPWAELNHAYGTATDVPSHIRGLVSRDPEVCQESIGALYGSIWHQGTVYDATASAVPFLVKVASSAGVPDRVGVLGLLADISQGSGYLEVHRPLIREDLAAADELDAEEQAERRWVGAARAAVLAAAPALVELLDDGDAKVRRMVPYTLATLTEEAPVISAALDRRFRAEDDDLAAASQLLALAALARRTRTEPTRHQAEQVIRLAGGRRGVVRLAAAIAAALLAPDAGQALVAVDDFAAAAAGGYEDLTALWWAMNRGPVELMDDAIDDRPALQFALAAGLAASTELEVRISAARYAGQLIRSWLSVTAGCVDLLVQAAGHPDQRIRRPAVSELALSFPACRPAANALAASLDDPESRPSVIVTLAKLGDARAHPVTAAAVRAPDPPSWTGAALRGLGPAAAGLLSDVLTMVSRLPASRRGVLDNRLSQALGWVGSLGAQAGVAVPLLLELLSAGRAPRAVTAALARIGPQATPAVPALRAVVAAEADPVVRSHAAFAVWTATGDPGPLVGLGRELIGEPGQSATLLQYLEQVGPVAAGLAPSLASRLGQGWEWNRVRVARAYWKLTGATDRVVAELLALAELTPAGMTAIEALGWLGPAAQVIQPRLEDWLARDSRLATAFTPGDAVQRDEECRSTLRTTLTAVTGPS